MTRLIPDGTGGFYLDSGAGGSVLVLLALLAAPFFIISMGMSVVWLLMLILLQVGVSYIPPELLGIYRLGIAICVPLAGTVFLVLVIAVAALIFRRP